MKKFLIVAVAVLLAACSNNTDVAHDNTGAVTDNTPAAINYSVVNMYPHDVTSFTEGLLINNGQLYESTGGQREENDFKSWFGPVDLHSGKPLKKILLDANYFGEGINIINGKIYQLTWKDQKGFVYDAKTLKKLRTFTFGEVGWDNKEGWALTNDGASLIMSDGTNKLRYIDPETLKILKIISVEDNNGPVENVNELEYINGFIYANQWGTNYILKIDPASGKVVGRLDFSSLYNEVKIKYPQSLEMNGIAYDSAAKKIYVTGKAWPGLYEVRF